MKMHFHGIMSLLPITAILMYSAGPLERDMKHRGELEDQTIGFIAKTIPFYENLSGSKLTNMLQLFTMMTNGDVAYPYWHEHCFLKYHKGNLGFSNSVLERYVMVEPGIYLLRPITEVFIIGAQPYLNREKKLERTLIYKTKEGLSWGRFPEEHIQASFRDARRQIPAAGTPLPRPPPHPTIVEYRPPLTVQYVFERLAEAMGMQKEMWLTLLILAAFIGVIALVAVVLWAGRRNRTQPITLSKT